MCWQTRAVGSFGLGFAEATKIGSGRSKLHVLEFEVLCTKET